MSVKQISLDVKCEDGLPSAEYICEILAEYNVFILGVDETDITDVYERNYPELL